MTVRAESAGDASDAVVRAVAPCVLPEGTRRVEVVGDRYWPVSRERRADADADDAPRVLPVQRFAGALPYAADPTGARAGASKALRVAAAAAGLRPPRLLPPVAADDSDDRDGPTGLARDPGDPPPPFSRATGLLADDAVGVFTSDPTLLGFKRLMCEGEGELADFHRAALHECMSREEPAAATAYVDARAAAETVVAAASRAEAEAADRRAGGVCARLKREEACADLARAVADVRLLAAHARAAAEDDGAAEDERNPERPGAAAVRGCVPASLLEGCRAAASAALDRLGFDAPGGALAARASTDMRADAECA